MKPPTWWNIFVRKLPNNLTGQVILIFRDGLLVEVERRDVWNEKIFYERFREYAIDDTKTEAPNESRDA